MEHGTLTDPAERDRLAYWYQEFSNFIISGNSNPLPVPRFIMWSVSLKKIPIILFNLK